MVRSWRRPRGGRSGPAGPAGQPPRRLDLTYEPRLSEDGRTVSTGGVPVTTRRKRVLHPRQPAVRRPRPGQARVARPARPAPPRRRRRAARRVGDSAFVVPDIGWPLRASVVAAGHGERAPRDRPRSGLHRRSCRPHRGHPPGGHRALPRAGRGRGDFGDDYGAEVSTLFWPAGASSSSPPRPSFSLFLDRGLP